jgi:hypothetical protein
MKIKIAAALIAAALTGCATAEPQPVQPAESYESALARWVGVPEVELLRKHGTPQSTYETASTKFITYVRTSSRVVPGYPPTYTSRRNGNSVRTTAVGGAPTVEVPLRCATTFEIDKGVISGWSYEGNWCE